MSAVKEWLRKPGVQNEKVVAGRTKLIKEAEQIDAEIRSRRIEDEHRKLAYLAKQLRLIIETQRYMETGSVDGLLSVLKDLGGA